MPKYTYKVQLVASGGEMVGEAEAADKFELAKNMKMEGKLLLSATEQSGSKWNMDKIDALLSRIDLREKILFSRNMSTMIQAGLPLSRALQIFLKQTKNPKFRLVLASIVEDINKGTSFSDSLDKFPDVFPPVFVSMVRAGEESGGLVDALNVVGGQMEKTYMITKKVKGAMIYPGIVLSVMLVVGALMMIYVVPGLSATFAEVDVELPVLTKGIIAVSEFLQHQLLLTIAIVVAFAVMVLWYKKTVFGARSLDYVVLRAPVFGKLVKEFNSALATRTLSSLISAGVDIVHAIDISRDVVTNSYYKDTLDVAKANVQKGVPLSKVFIDNSNIYPVMVGDMMEVGEETGQLSSMLLKIATFYEEEVDQATADMSKLIEPLLMVIIAGFVGIFAVAMITPMYTVMTNI
ncbi:MAG: Type II secretory pathway, component PulF [Parcubacteria group bacterium GW2011_GWA2_47_7]|nr:MAG: Type II secretory pathway, component PulF [Parcubacteria group bacterium GW2011_GWA2_47_7]